MKIVSRQKRTTTAATFSFNHKNNTAKKTLIKTIQKLVEVVLKKPLNSVIPVNYECTLHVLFQT